MQIPKAFDSKDVRILVDAISLVPNLPLVALAAKRARQRLTYPIGSHDQLVTLLDDPNGMDVGGRTISAEDIKKYVPAEYFPIDNQQELMCRLLIAFQRGDLFHHQELVATAASNRTQISPDAAVIPMPSELYGDVERV